MREINTETSEGEKNKKREYGKKTDTIIYPKKKSKD